MTPRERGGNGGGGREGEGGGREKRRKKKWKKEKRTEWRAKRNVGAGGRMKMRETVPQRVQHAVASKKMERR